MVILINVTNNNLLNYRHMIRGLGSFRTLLSHNLRVTMNSNADVTRRRSSRLSTTASAVKDSDSKDASAPRRHRLASSPIPEERPAKRPKKSQSVVKEATAGGAIASTSAVTKRKKKAEIVYQPDDFPARSESDWKIGPHVSSAGGVENTIINAASIGFVKSL